MSTRSTLRLVSVGLTASLLFAACGGGGDDDADSTPDSVPDSIATPEEAALPLGGGDDVGPDADELGADFDLIDPDDAEGAAEGDAGDGSDTDDPAPGAPAAPGELSAVTVDGTALAPYDQTAADPTVGVATPVVSGADFDGSPVTIGGPAEAPTLVVFLAHWCPDCNAELAELLALADAGQFPDGLRVVAVSTAVDVDRENYPPSAWLAGWPFETLADDQRGATLNAFGGTAFPFAVVVGADGTVLARRAGASSGADTLAFVAAALG